MPSLPNNNRKNYKGSPDLYVTNHPLAMPGLFSIWQPGPMSIILEPCCGMNHITRFLEAKGHIVHAFDQFNWGHGFSSPDFDASTYDYGLYDTIITNPPYNKAMGIADNLLRCLEPNGYMALLLRVDFQCGMNRVDWLKDTPLRYILPFSYRITCDKVNFEFLSYTEGPNLTFEKSPNSMLYAWYIWENGYKGNPEVRYILKDEALKHVIKREV